MTISDREVHAELFKPREERIKSFKYTNVYVKYIPKHWTKEVLQGVFEEATGGKVTNLELWKQEYGTSACLNFEDPDAAKRAVELLNGKDVASFNVPEPKEEDKEAAEAQEAAPDAAKEDEEKKADGDTKQSEADADADAEAKADDAGDQPKAPQGASPLIPTKLYVARAQKKKERKEYLQRQQKKRGVGARRNYTGANLYVKNLSPDVDDNKLHEMFVNFGNITSAKVMREASGKSRGFGFVAFEKKEAATRAIHEMTNTLHHGKPLYVSRAQTKAFRQTFIMKQLRSKRIRGGMNQGGPSRGGGGGGGRGQYGPYGGGQQQQQYGPPQGQGQYPPSYGGNPQMGRGMPMQQQFAQPYAQQMAMGQFANPQLQRQQQQAMLAQQMAAQQLAAQQRAAALQQNAAMQNPAMMSAQQQALAAQQLSVQQQLASAQAAQMQSGQMSSIQQRAVHQQSQSMGQNQQSQPAQSMASGPQSTSMYAGSQSRPLASGLTAPR